MHYSDDPLWQRLEAMSFDIAGADFRFSTRLAVENDWSRGYAVRAIEEYRRFVYLAMLSRHPVTPSDEVDQVWHLHLTYSRHYWDELCGRVLGRPLHHGPTEGGEAEDARYWDQYAQTLEFYAEVFGEEAPKAWWPPCERRFDTALAFRRIDVHDLIIIEKAWLRHMAALAFIGALLGFVAFVAANGGIGFVTDALAQAEDPFAVFTREIESFGEAVPWIIMGIGGVCAFDQFARYMGKRRRRRGPRKK